jgi:hypothetical protein
MYFTQEDYRKIEAWLKSRAVKDSEFMPASPLNGKEWVAILQDGHNKKVRLKTLLDQHSMLYSDRDLINVTKTYDLDIMSFEEAIQYIPEYKRYGGLIITFMDDMGYWQYWQFVPHSKCENITEEEWNDRANWKTLENDFIRADDEDTFEFFNRKLSRTEIKFKDKKYEPLICSGLGRKYLRKRIEFSCNSGEEALCVLKQEDVSDKNTIYIIQYDYTLNGETITVAEGSVLWFQGGRLKNGTLNTNGAALWGIDSTDDCVLEDNPAIIEVSNSHRGELLTFYGPSEFKLVGEDKKFYIETATELYQKIDGTYFPSINRQSPDNIYDTVTSVQQLKWYDGTEWIPLLDERDYNNIRKEIEDFYDLIRNDVQQVFEYYTPYLKKYDLMFQYINSSDSGNNKGQNIKWTIDDLYAKIGKLDLTEINKKNTEQDTKISNLETKVSELENIKPVKSVSINKGTKNTPDENGNVDLTINFPEPPSFDTTEIEKRLEDLEKKDGELDEELEDIKNSLSEDNEVLETFYIILNKKSMRALFRADINDAIDAAPDNPSVSENLSLRFPDGYCSNSDYCRCSYAKAKNFGDKYKVTWGFEIKDRTINDEKYIFDVRTVNLTLDNNVSRKDCIQEHSEIKTLRNVNHPLVGILDSNNTPWMSWGHNESNPYTHVHVNFVKGGPHGPRFYNFFNDADDKGNPLDYVKEIKITVLGKWEKVE